MSTPNILEENSINRLVLDSDIKGLSLSLPKFDGKSQRHCLIWTDFLEYLYLLLGSLPESQRTCNIKNLSLQRSEGKLHEYIFDKINLEVKAGDFSSWEDFKKDILSQFGFSNEELEDMAKKDLLFVRQDFAEDEIEYLKRIEKTAKIAHKEKYLQTEIQEQLFRAFVFGLKNPTIAKKLINKKCLKFSEIGPIFYEMKLEKRNFDNWWSAPSPNNSFNSSSFTQPTPMEVDAQNSLNFDNVLFKSYPFFSEQEDKGNLEIKKQQQQSSELTKTDEGYEALQKTLSELKIAMEDEKHKQIVMDIEVLKSKFEESKMSHVPKQGKYSQKDKQFSSEFSNDRPVRGGDHSSPHNHYFQNNRNERNGYDSNRNTSRNRTFRGYRERHYETPRNNQGRSPMNGGRSPMHRDRHKERQNYSNNENPRYSERGVRCFKCHVFNHMARDCQSHRRNTIVCSKCSELNHFATNCLKGKVST